SHSSLNSSVRTFNNSDEAEVRRSQRAFGSNFRATRPVSPIPITRLIPACPLPLIIRGPPHSLDRWLGPAASFRDGRRRSNSEVGSSVEEPARAGSSAQPNEGEEFMRSRILAVLAMLLVVGISHGWAQETTGAVSGRVTDAQGLAVPGVTVTLTGPQGSKSAVTDADGRYSVPLLVPGTYTAKAELQGFKSVQQQNVIVRLGQSIEVQLKMEVGGVAETIEVTASSPTVDTRSTTVGAVLDSEMLKNVPVGRRFGEALSLAPGVTSSGSAGSATPSMGGGSGLDNQYVVDGVNITNTGYGAL